MLETGIRQIKPGSKIKGVSELLCFQESQWPWPLTFEHPNVISSSLSPRKFEAWRNRGQPWLVVRAHLHADNGVDEEEHGDEQTHIRQSLPEQKEKCTSEAWTEPVMERVFVRCVNMWRPWRTGQRSTAGCGWFLPVAAAWWGELPWTASGSSGWWSYATAETKGWKSVSQNTTNLHNLPLLNTKTQNNSGGRRGQREKGGRGGGREGGGGTQN